MRQSGQAPARTTVSETEAAEPRHGLVIKQCAWAPSWDLFLCCKRPRQRSCYARVHAIWQMQATPVVAGFAVLRHGPDLALSLQILRSGSELDMGSDRQSRSSS